MRQGFFAVDITEGRNQLIRKFDPQCRNAAYSGSSRWLMLRAAVPVLSPQGKARQLLCDILPERARQQFLEKDFFEHQGKIGVYRFPGTRKPRSIKRPAGGFRLLAVDNFCASYDRMAAEYLILRNDERLYWTKANIFPVRVRVGWRHVAIALFDVALVAKTRSRLFVLRTERPLCRLSQFLRNIINRIADAANRVAQFFLGHPNILVQYLTSYGSLRLIRLRSCDPLWCLIVKPFA
jgi:hypothetical protein